MRQQSADSLLPDPRALVGTFRRFGPFGPPYEIIGIGAEEPRGDRWMRIRVLESGELIDYKFSDILDDPKER
jgi:hypothetical protein